MRTAMPQQYHGSLGNMIKGACPLLPCARRSPHSPLCVCPALLACAMSDLSTPIKRMLVSDFVAGERGPASAGASGEGAAVGASGASAMPPADEPDTDSDVSTKGAGAGSVQATPMPSSSHLAGAGAGVCVFCGAVVPARALWCFCCCAVI